MQIELSKSQCKNIAEFIEFHFIDSIRDDTDIDNFEYVVDMCDAYKVLREAGKDNFLKEMLSKGGVDNATN